MPRLLLTALFAAAFAWPAAAASRWVLYATEASQQRVDGFVVSANTGLPIDQPPVEQQHTGGERPRRVLSRVVEVDATHKMCRLYVASTDRVQVFQIFEGGKLKLLGETEHTKQMQPHDIEIAPDGNTLYVPFRRQNTIAAFRLDANGVPTTNADGSPSADAVPPNPGAMPLSCVYGNSFGGWEDIEVANGKLYAAATNHVAVYGIDATGQLYGAARVPFDRDGNGVIDQSGDVDVDQDGDVDEQDRAQWNCPPFSTAPDPDAPKPCIDPHLRPRPKPKDRPVAACPLSKRGHLQGPVGLVVRDRTLILDERTLHRLQGFTLRDDGNFESISQIHTKNPDDYNPDETADPTKRQKKAERRSRKNDRTEEIIRYIGLTYFDPGMADVTPIVYAAAFKGRVDAFRLNPVSDPLDATKTIFRLPKHQTSATPMDVVSTPVRTLVDDRIGNSPTLYVAAGELDRVQAFKLFPGGAIAKDATATTTPEQKGSFPNDVVLVDTAGCN